MPDPRFFETRRPLSLSEAARLVGASPVAGPASSGLIERAASAQDPELAGALVYAEKKAVLLELAGRVFAACLMPRELADNAPPGAAALVAEAPKAAFATLAARLHRSYEDDPSPDDPAPAPVIHEDAEIHETAIIAPGAEIGAGARIGPRVYVGRHCVVGEETMIGHGASVTHALIAGGCRIAAGARIGGAGFGFVPGPAGPARSPQLGLVILEANVEVGANSTIDRGALGDTVVGAATKIDNLVQIGHNVVVGKGCVIAAQTGISGSCRLGDGVMIGGQAGLSDHVSIGAGARIAAQSGLMRDVPAGETWGGSPARLIKDWLRETAALSKLVRDRAIRKDE